jgi:uncharacterized protein YukE
MSTSHVVYSALSVYGYRDAMHKYILHLRQRDVTSDCAQRMLAVRNVWLGSSHKTWDSWTQLLNYNSNQAGTLTVNN